jgi:hypothetical protein
MAAVPALQVATGSIAGIVHQDDLVADGSLQPGEMVLSGISVELLNDAAEVIARAQTDEAGEYHFDDVWPGVYSIRDGQSELTVLSDIEVLSGQELIGQDFSPLPLAGIAAAFASPAEIIQRSPVAAFPFVPAARPASPSPVVLQIAAKEEYFPSSVDGESQPWRLSVLKPAISKGAAKVMQNASAQANPLRSGKWLLGESQEESSFGWEGATPLVGDFNGDGRDELGMFLEGEWSLDTNGNRHRDDDDTTIQLGTRADQPVVGDWDGDGDDDVGIYGSQGAIPVAGDFAGHGRDAIGLFQNGTWQLDADGDGRLTSSDPTLNFGTAGDAPIVGDFDGDGRDEIGVFRTGRWIIDSNHNGQIDAADKVFELGGAGDVPVVGDFDGDGVDEPGLYRGVPAARISRTR